MSDAQQSITIADLFPVIDPSVLSTLCEVPVDPVLHRAIVGSDRVCARMATRLAAALDLPATVETPETAATKTLLFGTDEQLDRLLQLAAGLAATKAIRQTVDRDSVAHLHTLLDADIYTLVLDQDISTAHVAPLPATPADLRASGFACLSDWIAHVSPPLASMLTLRFHAKDRALLDVPGLAHGQRLIDTAADLLARHEARDA